MTLASGAMAIPDFQTIMRPVLEMHADEHEHAAKEIREHIASHFSLTPEDLEVMLPSGRAKLFANRVGWAITYRVQVLWRDNQSAMLTSNESPANAHCRDPY